MTEKFIAEHAYLWYLANTALIVFCGWLIKRLIGSATDSFKQACESIADLYDKYNDHEKRLSHIEGEHSVLATKGHRKAVRDGSLE